MKRLLVAIIFLFVFVSSAKAEVTTPYSVDEKPQVFFGDSAEVISTTASTTYRGLQNYTTNYINNYLHIAFTYTHHVLAFSSYSPRLYITAEDPQATSTPTIRDQQEIHTLLSGTHPTDWYTYDVQFDATGYTVIVTQGDAATTTTSFHRDISNFTDIDWVSLANLYPKQDPVNEFSMAFTPLQVKESPPVQIATTTPIIIVPGISSSYLIKDNNPNLEIWMNIPQMLTSITDSYLDELDLLGNHSITARNIVRETPTSDFFYGLFSTLESNGFDENENLYEFPYDWRLDVADTALTLKNKIDEVKAAKGVDKVDLVAHSMGGLLIKKYLKDYGGDSVNKFVDIGTPHIGSPKAFKILNYGDDFGASLLFGLVGLNTEKVKSISQNMPSIYQLLPSQKYFDEAESNYYVFNGSNGSDRLTYSQTSDYLKAEGRNGALVDRAKEFHEEIDSLNPGDYGVETYNIVGCGTPTIGQFYILDDDAEHPIYNIRMINGDGTVPLKSAEAMTASTTYYVRDAKHALMPSTGGVKELVVNLLTSTSTPDISSYSNLSLDSGGCDLPNGKIVSFHSPIELHIYDPSNNHAGPNANGDIENNIPGVSYEEIDGNKFAYLPDGLDYTVRGNATDTGSFDVRIQEILNGEVATTTIFNDIPLALTTHTQFNLGSSIPTQITLDEDNDGTYEENVSASLTTQGFLESTGKTAVVSAETAGSSSSAKVAVPTEVATTSPSTRILLPEQLATTTQVALAPPVSRRVEVKSPPTVKEEVRYKNTATVYKSLGTRVKAWFKAIWNRFKSGSSP